MASPGRAGGHAGGGGLDLHSFFEQYLLLTETGDSVSVGKDDLRASGPLLSEVGHMAPIL